MNGPPPVEGKAKASVDGFALAIATCMGAGRSPIAPGTVGSLVGIPVYLVFQLQPKGLYLLSLLAFVALGAWTAERAEALLGAKDPPAVVIDEVAGLLVALAWISMDPWHLVAGFFLFRFFDIWKPYPARWLERRVPGGWGVVADDLVAGFYANLSLRIALRIAG